MCCPTEKVNTRTCSGLEVTAAAAGAQPPTPCAAPGSEPHRPIRPVVLLEDVLHAVLAAVREHHDHLIAVGTGDVGLGKSRCGVRWLLATPGSGVDLPPSGAPGPLVLPPTADGGICPSCLVGANKASRLDFRSVSKPGPLPAPGHLRIRPRGSRSAAGRRRTRSRPCSPWCPWPPCPARPP